MARRLVLVSTVVLGLLAGCGGRKAETAEEVLLEKELRVSKRAAVEYATPVVAWKIDGKKGQKLGSRTIVSHTAEQLAKLLATEKVVDGYLVHQFFIDGKIVRASNVPVPCTIRRSTDGLGIFTDMFDFHAKENGREIANLIGPVWTRHLYAEGSGVKTEQVQEKIGAVSVLYLNIPYAGHLGAKQGIVTAKYLPLVPVKDQARRDLKNLEPIGAK